MDGGPGPTSATGGLVAAFARGATEGRSPDAQVEGPLLLVGDEPLAIRLDAAVLVRGVVPDEAAAVEAELVRVLSDDGMRLVEADTPLALIVEAEVFARRAYRWDLWARDAEQGRTALAARAAGDMPGILEADAARRRDEAAVDSVLREMERHL